MDIYLVESRLDERLDDLLCETRLEAHRDGIETIYPIFLTL